MERPKYFYRFRAAGDEGQLERVRQILVDNQLYFARPASFNDPFDCWPLIDDTATEAEYLRHWVSRFGTQGDGFATAVTFARGMATGDPMHRKSSLLALASIREGLLNKHGVLCLNTNPTHQLMWAHYGDCHRGICIQFDAQHETFDNAEPVHYSKERAKLNIFTQDVDEQFRNAVGTKSDVWAYEEEWRVVETEFFGQVDIPPEAITGVILGARISEASAATISAWCAAASPKLPVYRAELIGDSYLITVPRLPV